MAELHDLGTDASSLQSLQSSAEKFLRMWERAEDAKRERVPKTIDQKKALGTLGPVEVADSTVDEIKEVAAEAAEKVTEAAQQGAKEVEHAAQHAEQKVEHAAKAVGSELKQGAKKLGSKLKKLL
jgi:hypothetical protein